MDSVHIPRYAASAVGLIFAAVGLGLSILSLLVSTVVPVYQFTPEDFVYQPEVQIRKIIIEPSNSASPTIHKRKHSLKRSSQSSLSSSEGPPTPKDSQHISPKIQRDESPPPPEADTYSKDQRPFTLRKPMSLTFSQPPSSPDSSIRGSPPNMTKTIWISTDIVPKKASKLVGLTSSWKGHEPKLSRQMSSPHLVRTTPAFLANSQTAEQVQLASSRTVPCKRLERILMLRRCKSLPPSSRPRMGTVGKKRPLPLRTQPYEAPYFAPLPQPVFVQKQEGTRRKRPHRSRTLDSITRGSTSTFNSVRSDTSPRPPLPPSFTRQTT